MIPHFKEQLHIHTDKQHFDTKQASMIVQEKEPLSPLKKKGCKSLAICTLFIVSTDTAGRTSIYSTPSDDIVELLQKRL